MALEAVFHVPVDVGDDADVAGGLVDAAQPLVGEAAGRDVGLQRATDSYLERVLRTAPDERLTLNE